MCMGNDTLSNIYHYRNWISVWTLANGIAWSDPRWYNGYRNKLSSLPRVSNLKNLHIVK